MAKDITVKATLEGGTLPAKASLSSGIVRASADIKDVIREPVPGDYVGPDVPRRTPEDLYTAGEFVYVPGGYYSAPLSAQSVEISQSLPKPSISVSNNGLITATEEITYGAFFKRGLTAEKTKQLTQQRSKTVTPSDVEQTAVAAGRYTVGDVKVAPIPYARHEVHLVFSDGTESDIPVYFIDPGKTVVSATVDGVTWQAPAE